MAEYETKTREEFDRLYPDLKGKAVSWSHFMAAMDCSVQAIKMLRERIDQLEAGGTKYAGVWQRPAAYARGTFVTHGGSMWHANEDTAGAEPGKSNAWTLAVKAGKDGRSGQ